MKKKILYNYTENITIEVVPIVHVVKAERIYSIQIKFPLDMSLMVNLQLT